ncbi:helix-turn-helix domain-containing protein [Rugamonas rubra]|uniref:CRP/FNR family transcriptional regulator, anaerobic regulatory protein n=1 Tax=Rugamonas rubra TaxID=758825 RepID=A0A1I4LB95_9BURK|nr:helix-turn-helix domain-containing protein [Rugamonas rubra]SFL88315.1 CRP/FNR family transcriptional regulator, anaerobic regulatory protein [Rugamonas rubra]
MNRPPSPISLAPGAPANAKPSCANCAARRLCLPSHVPLEDYGVFERMVQRRYQLLRGEHLYQMNEPVHDRLYVLRSGHSKTYHLDSDGQQRVTGFQMSGEFLGLDAIGLRQQRGAALALTDCEVCEISHRRLQQAADQSVPVGAWLRTLLSKELSRQQNATQLLRGGRAEQKFAIFLLRLSWCFAERGGMPDSFHLPMTRQEIGDYLGLTAATISRLLLQLKRAACVDACGRDIVVLDHAGLTAFAHGAAAPAQRQRA